MLRPRRGEPTGVGRTGAFSDGVFAVAITLLACAASLVFIGVAWTNHHNVFRRVALQTWTRPLGALTVRLSQRESLGYEADRSLA